MSNIKNNKPDGRKANGGKSTGRKKVDDKKVIVGVYVYESRIKDFGGKDAVRKLLLDAVEK